MVNLDQEYDLFRAMCRHKSIQASQKINDNIQRLIEKGLPIELRHKHYILTKDIYALSAETIYSGLNAKINSLIDRLDVVYETGSTNKLIINNKSEKHYSILLSEFQTDGSGRRQKKWVSPLGENIYLSIKFTLKNTRNIQFLPLLIAISICKSLSKSGINNCKIKWPNDLYLDDKKLGGILVESRYNAESGYMIIAGIGLNINMDSNQEIDQSWTSLFKQTNTIFDRNIIVSTILSELIKQFETISELKTQQFMIDWKPLDYLNGRKILIVENNSSYSATSLGIADDGALLVEYEQNMNKMIKKVYSADVSVKALDEL